MYVDGISRLTVLASDSLILPDSVREFFFLVSVDSFDVT